MQNILVTCRKKEACTENPMDTEGADIRSSIAVAYNNLFIRTKDKLYCVGK